MHMKLNDGREIEFVDWEDRSKYDVVDIRSPNFPPRYFGQYLRSSERKMFLTLPTPSRNG